MIVEYEKGRHAPSVEILARLVKCLETTADYLLGLSRKSSTPNQQKVYHEIRRVLANIPDPSFEYYWLSLEFDLAEDRAVWSMQTQWVGFTPDGKHELRALRPVDSERAIALCTKVRGAPMVINEVEDLETFLQFGGEAIIKALLVESCLPDLLEPVLA